MYDLAPPAGDLVMAFTAPYSTKTDKSESTPPIE